MSSSGQRTAAVGTVVASKPAAVGVVGWLRRVGATATPAGTWVVAAGERWVQVRVAGNGGWEARWQVPGGRVEAVGGLGVLMLADTLYLAASGSGW